MLDNTLEALTTNITNTELTSQMFGHFPAGVMVLNMDTTLVYYNAAQGRIDDLRPQDALGKTILDLYRVRDNSNFPTLRCLFARKPLVNYPCYYYTNLGKLVNSIHNVFPIISDDKLMGCICFVLDYGEITNQHQKVVNNLKNNPPGGSGIKKNRHTFAEIVTQDSAMRQSLGIISQAANTPSPIMIYGETGCGKEMFAQAIHDISWRRHKPFIALNCAAIPESLLEGMLFGTVKGAFTGSLDKPGLMELADEGTIFLDEINSMPLGLQSKMLRAIQDQKIRRVGASQEKAISLKIVSASNIHPQKAVANGDLRADLLFRLGVVVVEIPPLRERLADIPILTKYFIKKHNLRLNRKVGSLSETLEHAFACYHWPGNVRELEHAIEGAMNIASEEDTVIMPHHFQSTLFKSVLDKLNLDRDPTNIPSFPKFKATIAQDDERSLIKQALEESGGNAARAARCINISPQLMNYKMKKYGLKKEK